MSGNDEHCVLLLRSDHADGSADVRDYSLGGNGGAGHALTFPDDPPPVHSAEQRKFGATSIKVFANQGIRIAPHEDLQATRATWTVDFWRWGWGGNAYPFSFGAHIALPYAVTPQEVYRSGGYLRANVYVGSGGCASASSIAWGSGAYHDGYGGEEWTHFAVEREHDVLRLYLNGRVAFSTSMDFSGMCADMLPFYVGSGGPPGSYSRWWGPGYLDEFRVSTVARYGGESFDPPTEPYAGGQETAVEALPLRMAALGLGALDLILAMGASDGRGREALALRLAAYPSQAVALALRLACGDGNVLASVPIAMAAADWATQDVRLIMAAGLGTAESLCARMAASPGGLAGVALRLAAEREALAALRLRCAVAAPARSLAGSAFLRPSERVV